MCKLTVIENNSVGFIFGLDNMRSHRCFINLATNTLDFPDSSIKVNFLSDGEVVKSKAGMDDEEDEKDIEKAQEESLKNLK
jgi:hypothetical protein